MGPAPTSTFSRPGLLLAVLALGGGAYAMMQSLVVPALPVLQDDLHTTPTGVAWVFTAYLLAASVATPIAGRLGDMFGKKRTLVVVLAGMGGGTLVAALATTLPVMIGARAIQGLGGAIFPLAFGIVRDEFPRERVAGGIALISGLLGVGGGLGIILGGPDPRPSRLSLAVLDPAGRDHVAVIATIVIVPESPIRAPGNVNWLGATLLTLWLICLLVAISEAPTWGWFSARTLGLLIAAAVLAVAWVRAESRSVSPLVDMTMMRLRGVWTTNLAGLLIGFGMYSAFVLIPQFVQTPTSDGYGFGSSVTQSGLFLVPTTIAMMIASPLGGRLSGWFGSKVPLVLGATITMLAFVLLAAAHTAHWQVFLASLIDRRRGRFCVCVDVEPHRRGRAAGSNGRGDRDERGHAHHRRRGGQPGRREHPRSEPARRRNARGARVHAVVHHHGRRTRRRSRRVDRSAGQKVTPCSRRLSARAATLDGGNEAVTPGIVVGIDGSPQGEAALRFAFEEARLRGLPLQIVCAWEPSDSAYIGEAFVPTPDVFLAAENRADDVLRTALEQLAPDPAIDVEALSVEGHAATVLVEQARDAKLLVVGSRGRGAAASLLLGSVSQSIAHHAPCPLVIVPYHDH